MRGRHFTPWSWLQTVLGVGVQSSSNVGHTGGWGLEILKVAQATQPPCVSQHCLSVKARRLPMQKEAHHPRFLGIAKK